MVQNTFFDNIIENLNLSNALISEKNQEAVGSLLLHYDQNKVYATLQSTDLNEYSFKKAICQAQNSTLEFIRPEGLIVSLSDKTIATFLVEQYAGLLPKGCMINENFFEHSWCVVFEKLHKVF